MADRDKIGVRYCGGCNSRYDRVALVRRLEAQFPGWGFVPARPQAEYAALVVVCGCPARCVNISSLTAPAEKCVYITDEAEFDAACRRLSQAIQPQEE
ncbi:MAG TPA: hypothetical protein VN421_09425 [Pseudoflavonifractor sp.]|jgi:3-hydroxyacyl-[acyl-carrier-protein] dehydratase|nr:hypothetical protein [Pseudoflavonifractor sp.]